MTAKSREPSLSLDETVTRLKSGAMLLWHAPQNAYALIRVGASKTSADAAAGGIRPEEWVTGTVFQQLQSRKQLKALKGGASFVWAEPGEVDRIESQRLTTRDASEAAKWNAIAEAVLAVAHDRQALVKVLKNIAR